LLRPLLIPATRQRRKSLGPEDLSDSRRTQGELSLRERLADFIDGMILFAQGDRQRTGRRLVGLGARAPLRGDEESGAGVADKRMTKDAEGAGRIAESAGDFLRGALVDVIGAKGLVLAVPGIFRFQEKAPRLR
jgi:hypothetical protein